MIEENSEEEVDESDRSPGCVMPRRGCMYVIMELCDTDLHTLLMKTSMDINQAVQMFKDIVTAIEYIHAKVYYI